ncbi:unnamed protein product [Hymenolepis diminuta]|uniref:peptidylprolyl isomerase n=1 Tax=Hymenolepis diminuta TaxID=6216 RepID=A0A564Y0V3_HYMDI|nr:unnamed protein product [Hymenolepis diminuta]
MSLDTLPSESVTCNSTSNVNESKDSAYVDILGNGTVLIKTISKGLGQGSRPSHGDSVVINYKCYLEDGTLVEESENLNIVIGDGDCIHAIDLTLPFVELMENFELITDARFAYGALGNPPTIPPNAKLIYRISLIACNDPPCYEKISINERFEISNRKRERGNFYFRREDYQHALSCYSTALEILLKKSKLPVSEPFSGEKFNEEMSRKPTPTDAQIRDLEIKLKNNMAASQLKLLAYTATIGSCNEVLLLDPTNIKALYRKAQALEAVGEFTEAIEAYEEGLRHHPTSEILKKSRNEAQEAWKKERSRQSEALFRYFKKHNICPKNVQQVSSFADRLKGLWSDYKIGISVVALAGVSVILGGAFLHFSNQQ